MSTQPVMQVPDYNWKTIPVRESRKGIMQRVFRGNDVLVGYSELHPHMDPSPHSHQIGRASCRERVSVLV